MKRHWIGGVLCGIAFVILGLATPANAQDRFTREVRAQLRAQAGALNLLSGGEVEEAFYPFLGSLYNNYYKDVTYRLIGGTTYLFTGACDEDCSDLDLKLFDPDGDMVKKDTEPDDHPVILYTPEETGTYTIRVIMARCNRGPCKFGVGVFK